MRAQYLYEHLVSFLCASLQSFVAVITPLVDSVTLADSIDAIISPLLNGVGTAIHADMYRGKATYEHNFPLEVSTTGARKSWYR